VTSPGNSSPNLLQSAGAFLRSAARRFAVDRAVAYIFVNKFLFFLRGPVTIIFIVRFLSPEQQGIWYAFTSLSALSVFADLGFTYIITQLVSHEYAGLQLEKGLITGREDAVDRFFSLVKFSLRFYTAVILAASALLIVIGYFFFISRGEPIFLAWCLFAVIGGANLFLSLLQSIYQGLNKVAEIQKILFVCSFVTPVLSWLFLFWGLGIWTLVLSGIVGISLSLTLLARTAPAFWKQVIDYKVKGNIPWLRQLLPLQGKYAVSWVSGYFIFNLFVPVTFQICGAVTAGQLGITLAVLKALFDTSNSWIDSRIPQFNMLVSDNKRVELMSLFRKYAFHGVCFFVFGALGLMGTLCALNYYHFYETRFLPPLLIAALLMHDFAELLIGFMGKYLRAHKDEPYYLLSLLGGVMVPAILFFALPRWGLWGVAVGLNILKWLVGFPLAITIFRKFVEEHEGRHFTVGREA